MGVTFGFNLRITSKLIDGIKVSYHEIQRNGKRILWHTLPSPHQLPRAHSSRFSTLKFWVFDFFLATQKHFSPGAGLGVGSDPYVKVLLISIIMFQI